MEREIQLKNIIERMGGDEISRLLCTLLFERIVETQELYETIEDLELNLSDEQDEKTSLKTQIFNLTAENKEFSNKAITLENMYEDLKNIYQSTRRDYYNLKEIHVSLEKDYENLRKDYETILSENREYIKNKKCASLPTLQIRDECDSWLKVDCVGEKTMNKMHSMLNASKDIKELSKKAKPSVPDTLKNALNAIKSTEDLLNELEEPTALFEEDGDMGGRNE